MEHTPTTSMRDRDFLRSCRRVIAQSRVPLTSAQVAAKAAESPAPAFYVTFSHALRRIRYIERHGAPTVSRSEACRLYAELFGRVHRLMASRGMSDADALTAVLASGNAPGFYISRTTAAYLYSTLRRESLRRKCRTERTARLRRRHRDN